MIIRLFVIEDVIIGITHWHSLVLLAFDLVRDCRLHNYLLGHDTYGYCALKLYHGTD